MTQASDRTWMRLGGWAALAAGLLASLRVVGEVTVFREMYLPGRPRSWQGLGEYWGCAALEACAVAVAVSATFRLLQPSDRVLRAGGVAGAASAAMLLAGSALSVRLGLQMRDPSLVAVFACVPLGVWMLCVAAADWKLRRLPVWLRFTGAILGAVLMILPAVPWLRLVAVLGLPWWIGLGAVLMRGPRSTSS